MFRLFSRSRHYLQELRNSITINNKDDAEKVEEIHAVYQKFIKKRRTHNGFRIFFYIALYATILSSINSTFDIIPVLNNLVSFILTFFGIIGTTICVVMIALLTHSINTYDEDISTMRAHMIAIYVKYDKNRSADTKYILKKLK